LRVPASDRFCGTKAAAIAIQITHEYVTPDKRVGIEPIAEWRLNPGLRIS
jgi:hypothetical protein